MAEAIGIIGGISGMIELGKQLSKFYDFCNDVRNTPEDIRRLTTETTALRSMLKASSRYAQQLKSYGSDTKELICLHLEASEWIGKVEQLLNNCPAEVADGRRLTLVGKMKFQARKKKIRDQLRVLEGMKTTLMWEEGHLERFAREKRYDDIEALLNAQHEDQRSMLLDILNKIDPTSESVKRSTRSDGKLPSQQIAMPQPRQQRHTDGDSKACSRMPLARPTVIKPTDFAFALEALAVNQFHVLVACIFLHTENQASISQARNLLQQYPTPESLANARYDEIQPFFKNLGLFKRADWLIGLARTWLVCPPQMNKQYEKRGARPFKSEIAHLKGVGPFANDAWRIFCRDSLYENAVDSITIPEWKKVVPTNKGLIAYLHYRWDKEGFIWDERTGDTKERRAELFGNEIEASEMPESS